MLQEGREKNKIDERRESGEGLGKGEKREKIWHGFAGQKAFKACWTNNLISTNHRKGKFRLLGDNSF